MLLAPHNSNRRPCLPRSFRGLGVVALVLGLWLFLGQGKILAQSYPINTYTGQTVTATAGTFYDSGGTAGSYGANEIYTVTFNSGTSDKLKFTFSSFSTEASWDYLYVYDGNSVSAAQVPGSPFSGTTLPGAITSTSNSLTFKFVSDSSVVSSGWAAAISSVVASDYGDYSGFFQASATASSSLFMGTNVTDAEASTPANSTANGDDNSGTNDEDLTVPAMTAGASSSFSVPVFNNTGATAYLSIWIDYNNNGSITDSGEKVINSLAVSSNSVAQTLVLSVPIPTTAATGQPLGIRYRLDSSTGVGSSGIGGVGEVEDFLAIISVPTLDFGDFSGFGNAASTRNSNLRLGVLSDAEGAPTKNSTATGDNTVGSNDEDGVTMPSSIVAGKSATFTVNVTNLSGADAYLNAWIDYNNGGSLLDSGEQIAANIAVVDGTSGAAVPVTFTVPSTATQTTVGVRFRLTTTSNANPTGTSGVGEVEDYVVLIQPSMTIGNLVWNDANNNGVKDASETGIGGATVDLYSPGPDNTVNTADDVFSGTTTTSGTGFYFFGLLAPGKYYVKVTPPGATPKTSGTPVTSDNDVDNNNDGSQPGGLGTTVYSPIITLTSNGESVADGDTDSNTNMTVDFGLFSGFTVGNLVFNDANNNGVQDPGELGIGGLTVELLTSAGASFSPAVTTTTNSSGTYGFTVYSPGTYKIKVTPNTTYPVGSSLVGTDNATDNNDDGNQPGAQGTPSTSFAFTLTAGAEPGTTGSSNIENTIDFGFLACPTIAITPTSLAPAVVAAVYSQGFAFSASGGTAPYAWTVTGLPSGMSWDSVNLKYIGTPLFSGSYNVSMTATDAKGCATTTVVAFQVSTPPVLSTAALPGATVGAAYSTTVTATETGFDLQQSASNGTITNLAGADAVLAGTNRKSNWTGSGLVVNFVGSGSGDGNYVGTIFPNGPGDDFAVRATGVITIPTSGIWTFGINSDDGCRLKIDGVAVITDDTQHANADRLGTANLTAGTHTIDAIFFERGGGEAFELFAASGSKSSFSTAFKLIGGSGGLAVVRPSPTYTWSLTSGALPPGVTLNSSTGALVGTATLAGVYSFTLSATDANGWVGSNSYTINAMCPTFTMTPAAGALSQGTVGTAYSQSLSSSGSLGTVSWSVTSGTLPAGLTMNDATGLISGTPTASTTGTSGTSISIRAQDQYGCSVTQAYTLKICPVLSFAPATLTAPTVGTFNSQTISASNGTGPYTYAVSSGAPPSGLSLSSAGVLSGTPTSATSATFTVQATDAYGCVGTASYTVLPVCPAFSLSPVSMAVGTVGTAYSQTLSASGGTAPYTWALQTGTLPAGLSLNTATGVVSGTPTTSTGSGTALTFKATDTYLCAGTISYSLKICPVISVSPASLPTGTVGSAYSAAVTSSGGASPITFAVTSGSLPAGLTMTTDGVISGTPTAGNGAGASFTITATDANGCLGTVISSIKICPILGFSPTTLAVPVVGTAYTPSITAGNGVAPYTFSISNGVLPPGLSLSSAGVFSGIPTNTISQTFTVSVTDANGCPGSVTYTLTPLCPTLLMGPTSLNTGTVGSVFAQALTASVGTAPYSWAISSGALPAGLSMTTSGVISGTPSVANGSGVSITFRVTDTYGCTNTKTYNFKICPVVSLSPTTLTGATVGTPYTQTITASGGVGPYTFSKSAGTLPAGLTLSSAGVLSGTPTSSASANFTVKALDANNCSGALGFNLTPVCPAISIAPSTIVSGTVGSSYSQTLTASGGNSPYTWSVQTGPLPAGLTLSSTGVISGTPTASNGAGASITFKATDVYGCAATLAYTLKICPVLALGPVTMQQGFVGAPYSSSITASGGAAPYTFALTGGTLPAGLSLNTSSGLITGTPTTANDSGVVLTFQVTDANNCPGTFSTTLQICPIIALSPASFNTPTVGFAFSQAMSASNGVAPYTYSIESGTLPAGLTLSSAGVLSGTATSTTPRTFVVRAFDALGCPAVRTYFVTPVCPAVTITPSTLLYGTVGTSYSQTFTATGGNSPNVWSVQSGTLPAGLSLSAAGTLSGTPTASNGAGTSLTFAATDPYGCATTITYNLKICPIVTVSPAVLPYGTVGAAYSSAVSQTGGAAPATFAVTAGTLPAGLSLASGTGLITGTPTTSNGAGVTVTFTATDANGCPGTVDSLFKICPVIAVSPANPSTPVVGFAYSQTLTASNGAAPYTWTVASGTLPAGLSLSSSGILSGIATSTASQTFTVQATDVNGCPANKTYTVTPVCPTVLLAPNTIAAGTVGTPYSQTLTASGGTAPYTFTVQSGTLPAGLALSTTGVISGTPTTSNGAGVVIQFKAIDVYGCPGTVNAAGTANYTLKICPVISITPASPLPAATLGVAYTQALTASGGAGSSYVWSVASGSLPSGLTLSSTGVISGTPTVVNSFNFSIKALDSNNCPGLQTYVLPVQCPPISVSPASLADGTIGIGYTQTLSASGGTAPYSWTVTGGTLPAGLTLSSSGVISGTPTATNGAGVSVTFTGTDSNPNACNGVKTYNIKICPVVQISPSTLPPLTIGVAYSQTVAATGGAGPYTYSVFNGSLPAWASLDPNSGLISGTPTDSTSSTFVIKALDVNGCPGLRSYTVAAACPVIAVAPTSASVPTVGTPYSISVTGGGGSSPYTYAVTGGALPSWAVLNASTGQITGTPNNTTSATFTITVSDAYGCSGARGYTLAPVCPAISLAPATLGQGTVGAPYAGVVTASGGNAPYSYAVTAGTLPSGLSFSAATGQISGTPTAATSGTTGVALTIRATDAFGCQATQIVNLKVCPVLTFTPASLAAGVVGVPYSQTVTAANGAAPYSYSISSGTLPTGLSMTSSGVISGTPTVAVSANITVSVTDANGCAGSVAYTLATSCPVISISPGVLSPGTQGVAYSGLLSASGGTAPYGWSVASGTLPAGLTLSAGGAISGTPSISFGGGVTVTFQAVDSFGCTATKTYSFKVCPVIGFSQNALNSGTVGTAYSQSVTATNGFAPYTYSVTGGTLPGGLTLNGSTGVISGTPTASNGAGVTITIQAVDANGCPGSKDFTLKICPIITVSPNSLPIPQVGSAYSQILAASGGAAPYSYSITTGSLPAWASLNPATGVIFGTPNTTVGSSFTVTAVDVNGCTGSQVYSFTPACPTITLFPSSLPAGTVGTAYSQTLFASGGSSPYTWTVVSGSLPSGLTLTSAGLLSGTPSAANGAGVSFTVRATDNLSCSSFRTLTLKICPVLTMGPSSLAAFVNGIAYSQTITASGGAAPYTFTVTGGALPSWATLNSSSGVVSGLPNNNNPASMTVTATDANGCSASRTYNMVLLSLKVGNLVWSDGNNNGVRDPGENGIANVRIELWSAGVNGTEENGAGDDVKVIADVTTDANGAYLFVDVPAGSNYYVRIPAPPSTNAVTSGTPVVLDNGVDNDNNGRQPGGPGSPIRSPLFALTPSSEPDTAVDGDDNNGELTIDFGLATTISVGNLVFKDVDNSGTFDSSIDIPLNGVRLYLFAQGADPLSATPVATTTTANGGLYLFSVRAANYFVYVPASQFGSAGPLYGMKPARGRTDNTVPNIDDSGDQNALASSKPIATGVKTGVFTLASGVMPIATSGETGYLSNSDASADSDTNLTVDLGFYAIPVVMAPLAGRVTRDLTGLGDPSTATTALVGVQVSLYEDINSDGKLDANEMTAVATKLTDHTGCFCFGNVPAGDYIVVQSVLPGAEATFDSDGGDATITAITIDGDPVVDVNFLQAITPDTFAQWQQVHSTVGTAATDNPDGDLASNLVEYALGSEASAGADKQHFWLEANASGSVDAVMLRNTSGHKDVVYQLEGSADLTAWTRIATPPSSIARANGTEVVRYPGIVAPFVRLKVLLDANLDGVAEATAATQAYGWTTQTFNVGSRTFSMPLLKAEVFAGLVSAATGADLASGKSYFAEVISGTHEGQRFEVDEARSNAASLAFEGTGPVASDRIVVRPHWTLNDLFPVTSFHSGNSAADSDRIMFFNGAGYNVYWLMSRPTGNRWVRDGDAALADAGATVVGPLDGVMVNARSATVAVSYVGAVRSWKVSQSLKAGAQMVGTGSPLALSAADRAMNSLNGFGASDAFRLWLGDKTTSATAYSSFTLQQGAWIAEDGRDASNEKLFEAYRAAWIISGQGITGWIAQK